MVNAKKPTPLDEAKNIIHILRHTYYDAIGEMFSYVKRHRVSKKPVPLEYVENCVFKCRNDNEDF